MDLVIGMRLCAYAFMASETRLPVNGVTVEMRMMPRELQEQAYGLGLIPFVPVVRGRAGGAS